MKENFKHKGRSDPLKEMDAYFDTVSSQWKSLGLGPKLDSFRIYCNDRFSFRIHRFYKPLLQENYIVYGI